MAKKSDKYSPQGDEGFGTFLYNSNTGQILGRTCGSWFKITVFYIIFYALLAAFFYVCYQIFATTLERPEENGSPKWTQDSSLIGSNPGVGFRPNPDQDKNSESTLIWYRREDRNDYLFWADQLNEFVNKSGVPDSAGNALTCSYGAPGTGDKNVCKVNIKDLGDCKQETHFGYPDGKPCVLIKLNKIFDWQPKGYGLTDGRYSAEQLKSDLDEAAEEKDGVEGMPSDLREHILNQVRENPGKEDDILKTVWLSCSGENVGDKENLPPSTMVYRPQRGIPGYYFPYKNQDHYKTPFIMVQFSVPEKSRHTLINIECRAWAKNIIYDRQSRLGSVHFEILVD